MHLEEVRSLRTALRFLVRGDDRGQRARLAFLMAVHGLIIAGFVAATVVIFT